MSRYFTFEAAGLGALEEDVYDLLLDAQRLSFDELSGARPERAAHLVEALERLEASGLVSQVAGSPPLYAPAPPDLAIEALVLRRRGELEQLRAHAVGLARRYWAAADRTDEGSIVQLVRGAEAVRQHVAHVQQAARREVVIVDRPPYPGGARGANDEEIVGLDRGVTYRCIYDAGLLIDEVAIAEVLRYCEAGERARTFTDPPLKLMIADAEVAIIPLDMGEQSLHDCAIVRGPSLVTALATCFEALWTRSVPLAGTGAVGMVTPLTDWPPEDRPSPLERSIIRMLAAGVKDDAIARQLEVSSRTINRYMERMMGKLGATTRFQAGMQAARLGWL
jgi:DNA-binding CsgD family transcriptional regulator/sugar-specific transcriptional regulator TrmB